MPAKKKRARSQLRHACDDGVADVFAYFDAPSPPEETLDALLASLPKKERPPQPTEEDLRTYLDARIQGSKTDSATKAKQINAAMEVARRFGNARNDPRHVERVELALLGFRMFLLLTKPGERPPREGFLVPTRAYLSRHKVMRCLRITIGAYGPQSSFEPKVDLAFGFVSRSHLHQLERTITCGESWLTRLWEGNWGKRWHDEIILLIYEKGGCVANTGANDFRVDLWKEAVFQQSEKQYFCIMLLWRFWRATDAPPKARAADLLSLGLLKNSRNLLQNFGKLWERAGAKKFAEPGLSLSPEGDQSSPAET